MSTEGNELNGLTMEKITNMTVDTLMSRSTFDAVYAVTDDIERQRLIVHLKTQAKALTSPP